MFLIAPCAIPELLSNGKKNIKFLSHLINPIKARKCHQFHSIHFTGTKIVLHCSAAVILAEVAVSVYVADDLSIPDNHKQKQMQKQIKITNGQLF